MARTISPRGTFQPGAAWRGNDKGPKITKLTDEGFALVVELAKLDKAQTTIANALGIDATTWQRLKRRDPRVNDALEYGRGLARDALVDALKKHGKRNFVPLIVLAKALHGFREGEAPPEYQRPSITINLAGATPLASYEPPKLIEQDDDVQESRIRVGDASD